MTERLTALIKPYDEIPELADDFFTAADVYHGTRLIKKGRPVSDNPKQPTTLRLDRAVLDYFKAGGKGYQTRINQVLADYVAKQTAKS